MSTYKLLYAGEVLDGQHPAVVRKRLATLLKLDDARMDVLFSGKAVVVKKSADDALKARYLTAFEKAGALLRVQALDEATALDKIAPVDKATTKAPAPGELEALPAGSDILSSAERTEFVPANIDTEHLKVQGAVFVTEQIGDNIPAPNVDHLSMAEVGAPLGQGDAQSADAEVVLDITFDLAEVGADIGDADDLPPPPAPDTSHITLQE